MASQRLVSALRPAGIAYMQGLFKYLSGISSLKVSLWKRERLPMKLDD